MQGNSFKASAPGRLDVMGGIADYSGSLVLQKAITQQTSVELALREDYRCIISSRLHTGEILSVDQDYRSFLNKGDVDYAFAQRAFKQNPKDAWSAYILGCALVLQKEKGVNFKGADIELQSEVPNGKGVASSASVEIASMQTLASAFNVAFSGTELAVLAQRAENLIVGAPCGLMDQLTSSFGKPDALLPIICQPDLVQKEITIPADISFIGIDSGIRHQVAGALYTDVRCAAFMGYTILIRTLGVSKQDIDRAKENQNFLSLPYEGYLSKITLDEYEDQFQLAFPDSITGKDFFEQYGDTIDSVTTVDKNKSYNIQACTAHPIYENNRVHQFQQYLLNLDADPSIDREETFKRMGELMLASHKSYSLCGLGTARTDEMVTTAMSFEGILGARITGGGNGGTVCLLAIGEKGRNSALSLHKLLCERYNENLALFW